MFRIEENLDLALVELAGLQRLTIDVQEALNVLDIESAKEYVALWSLALQKVTKLIEAADKEAGRVIQSVQEEPRRESSH